MIQKSDVFLEECFLPSSEGEITPFIPTVDNTEQIYLNAELHSDLDWGQAEKIALHSIEKGKKILWEVDFGLFARLKMPLEDQFQFNACAIAIDHFINFFWKRFKEHTLGLILYVGSVDFSLYPILLQNRESAFKIWLKDGFEEFIDEEYLWKLFCRDTALEYIQLIAKQLPGELTPFVKLKPEDGLDSLLLAQLISKERYDSLHRIISFYNHKNSTSLALCLPELRRFTPPAYKRLKEITEQLEQSGKPFKIISETVLTNEWQGIDTLICDSASVSSQGFRKLKGFCAAGGTIVTVGPKLDLSQEITLQELDL